jgi:hypothetical protein
MGKPKHQGPPRPEGPKQVPGGKYKGRKYGNSKFQLPQGPIDPELWSSTPAKPAPGAAERFDDEKDRS